MMQATAPFASPPMEPEEKCHQCGTRKGSGWQGFCARCEAEYRLGQIEWEMEQLQEEKQELLEEARREGWTSRWEG